MGCDIGQGYYFGRPTGRQRPRAPSQRRTDRPQDGDNWLGKRGSHPWPMGLARLRWRLDTSSSEHWRAGPGTEEVEFGPDGELLGVVVHSGLVLGRSRDVVAAVRRITAFPGGLALDTVVLARDIHAEAAGRREHAATTHPRAAKTAQREDKAAAQHDSQAAAQWEGTAAAERHQARTAAIIERRYLPSFDEAYSSGSGSPHRPARRCGWTPTSRRARRPRTTTGWRPPTGPRRSRLMDC